MIIITLDIFRGRFLILSIYQLTLYIHHRLIHVLINTSDSAISPSSAVISGFKDFLAHTGEVDNHWRSKTLSIFQNYKLMFSTVSEDDAMCTLLKMRLTVSVMHCIVRGHDEWKLSET